MDQIQYKWSDILTQITIKMNQLLLQSEYGTVCNSQKRVSSILIYLVKIIDLFLAAWPSLAYKLTQCLQVVVTLVKSNQQQGYIHNFPYFSYLIKKYQRFSHYQDVTFIARQREIARITKNQQSEYYNSISLVKISNQDLQFLHSGQANLFFVEIANNRMDLQSTYCVCCSQSFIHNSSIQNSNPLIHFFLPISPKKAFDNILILRGINGLCNANEGGIIIIGAQRIQGFIKANGVKYQSQQCFKLRQHQIKNLIKSLRPECIFLIEKISIDSNRIKTTNFDGNYLRYCIRILIFPKSCRYLTYIESTKNLKKQYEVYSFNQFSLPQRLVGLQLYQNMHIKYRIRIEGQRNYHSNISLLKIHEKSVRKIIPNDVVLEQTSLDEKNCLHASDQQQLQFTDDINIKHQFQSLLVVSSLNYDKYVYTFIQYLQESQLAFQVSRPYSNCFENIRSIWLISHKDKHLLIKTYFKNFQKRTGYKAEEIKLMPVYMILQVQSNKFTEFEESILKDRLMGRFNESECFLKKKIKAPDSQHYEKKELTFLKFKNLKRCLYAYMLFEQMKIRPYFIEQSNVNF